MRNNPGGNWTPGPWRWDGDSLWHFGKGYHDKGDPHIFTGILMENKLMDSEMLQANARLITTAPEMYEALKEIYSKGAFHPGWVKWIENALAKAEGRRE